MPQCLQQFWNLSQIVMPGSLCNSFGSLSAGVHERSRKWCAPQRLRTKITFVPLWLFDQVKQSGELLSPFAALPSLPLEETPPLWFVSHSDGVHQTPQNSKSLKNVSPLKKDILSGDLLVQHGCPLSHLCHPLALLRFKAGFFSCVDNHINGRGSKYLGDYHKIFRQPFYQHFYPGKPII